ncbi:hypothetical protein, partial [Escherichia coli]|uniref:hypothetical protein n=1 Tax=Escherichia coli TaxID=562 RepID=UPI00191C85C0
RLRRAGLVRLHWLTEWQKRGVPHLHGIAYFPAAYEASTVGWNWIAVAEKYGANIRSQHVVPVTDMQGWLCTWLSTLAVLRLTISVTLSLCPQDG